MINSVVVILDQRFRQRGDPYAGHSASAEVELRQRTLRRPKRKRQSLAPSAVKNLVFLSVLDGVRGGAVFDVRQVHAQPWVVH